MRMSGMVAIVTGASRGIGRAVAAQYALEGAKVAVAARPHSPTGLPGTIEETAHAIQQAGGEAIPIPCDVSDEAQVRAMVDQVMASYGRIDVLVNNAALMIPNEPFLDIESERWDQLYAVNVRGPYLTCRYVVPIMIDQRRGSIISMGSPAGMGPRPGGTVYCSSKAALHTFTLSLAMDLQEHNIAVNVLNPGVVKTEGTAALAWGRLNWDERVEPEEVGPSVVCLALQTAGSLTGRVLLREEFGKTWP